MTPSQKIFYRIGSALLTLLIGGFFLDKLFILIGDYPGPFLTLPVLNLAKFIAPGVSDVWKILLDVIYATIYGIYPSKRRVRIF